MKSVIVGAVLAAMSSAALADVSVGQFEDKRATLSDDKGSKAGNPKLHRNTLRRLRLEDG